MNFQHKNLAFGEWEKLTLMEQLGNVGSEISRAINWRGKDHTLFEGAIFRALELLDLTIRDPRWQKRLKEILRVREILCETVFGRNEYQTSLEDLDRYFFQFVIVARMKR